MPEELQSFCARNGVSVPSVFLDWLKVVNGANIGPGGVMGIQDEDPYCSIELLLHSFPVWCAKNWLPVAGDGCGNYYVLVPEIERYHVYFIDTIRGSNKLDFACASNLWAFLWFILKKELDESTWPFDREHVLQCDPEIVNCKLAPLPWDAG